MATYSYLFKYIVIGDIGKIILSSNFFRFLLKNKLFFVAVGKSCLVL